MLTSTRRVRGAAAIVAGVASLSLLAACSSSSSSSSTPSGGASSGASGTPITVGLLASEASQILSQPERRATANAAIQTINAAGGVNGHPLQLEFCDTKNDANGELSCTRQLIDKKVSALLSPALIVDQTGRAYDLAKQAGIPVIGGQGLTPKEFNSPGVFPTASGIPGWAYGSVASILDAGATKISLMGTNEAGSLFILGLCNDALKSAGITPVTWVKADAQADPTFSSSAALAIANGVDGILLDSSPTYIPKEVTALRNAGFKGKISSITAIFGPAILKALGTQAEGVLLTSQLAFSTDTANPAVAAWLAAMKQYAPDSDVNETSENVWTAFQLFAKVAATSTDTSAAGIMAAFNNLATPVDVGTAGPYQVKGATVYLQAYPNMYNPTVVNGSVVNGALKADGKGFINPFTTLESMKK